MLNNLGKSGGVKRLRNTLMDYRKRKEDEAKQGDLQKVNQEAQTNEALKTEAFKNAQDMKEDRKTARGEGKQYAEELFNRNIAGLNPQQRQSMEESGRHSINRQMQGMERNLLAKQGKHGIKGGAAYAQHADLARAAVDAQGQMQRDLQSLDSDLALKKLAAMFNVEQGEAGQAQLDRQLALDELKYEEEKKRNRLLEEQFNRQFSKV